MQQRLNMAMIERALKTTSFDLKPSDFLTSKYQAEIRYLFTLGYFPKFDSKNFVDKLDVRTLNKSILELKRESSQKFNSLYKYKLSGVGPGEVMLFFLINDAHLGGGLSTAADLFVKNKAYEIKSAKVSNKGIAYDFRLGGTVSLAKIMTALNDIRIEHKLGGSSSSISGDVIDAMRQKAPFEFSNVEKEYARLVEEYFSGHKVIFMNNSDSMSKMGHIESIQNVVASDVTIERLTSGTVKPRIKLRR